MEELLPLIIGGIIWLAYNYYGKSQKKQATKTHSTQSEETHHTREPSILEQILMGQEIKVPEPEPYYEEYEEENQKISEIETDQKGVGSYRNAFLSAELSNVKEEGQHAIDYHSDEKKSEIAMLYEENMEPVLGEDFDLKKAIIYEAVLNPPYIDFK